MSFIKKGTCDSSITVSSMVYVCSSCGHTEIASDGSSIKECPVCHTSMSLIASQSNAESPSNTPDVI